MLFCAIRKVRLQKQKALHFQVLTKAFFVSYSKKRGINLSLSKDLGDFKGGVVLSGGGVDKNLTLEVEIKLLREQTESEIAGLLFKGV